MCRAVLATAKRSEKHEINKDTWITLINLDALLEAAGPVVSLLNLATI
jgi:hypothetical protein